KLVRAELLASDRALSRFRREARAAARVSHPNVVAVHDAGTDSTGTHFLVMEFVEGSDLHKLVRQSGPLPVGQACEYGRQAALGLQHAHEHGLIHRDIKPGNLLLTDQGRCIKVTDFGLAFAHGQTGDEEGPLTDEGASMGTPDYMAPEQARDAHTVDGRADI